MIVTLLLLRGVVSSHGLLGASEELIGGGGTGKEVGAEFCGGTERLVGGKLDCDRVVVKVGGVAVCGKS